MTPIARFLAVSTVIAVFSLGLPGVALAKKPEDVFSGQIVITKKRLPARFSSADGFIQAIRNAKTDKVWPKEQKGNDEAVWKIEYIAFFAKPLNDYEVTVKFYDTTSGGQKFIAGDAQMTREKDSRIFASDIEVAKPTFEVNRRYLMTVEKQGHRIASTTFWLRGQGDNFSGKVEFSEEETRAKGSK